MDWQHTTLGEICELYQPKTISGKDMMSGGRYPVFGANGIIGRYHDFNHEAPQLVIGCRGSVGAVHVTEPYSWITGNSMVVKPKGNQLSVRFVEYYLRGGVDLSPAISGTAQPQITRTSLSPIPISFPPLPEQQRIVTKLDAAFAALAEAQAHVERNRANARELFESYLNGVFEGKEGWSRENLGALGRIMYGYTASSTSKPIGPKLLRITDIQDEQVEWTSVPHCLITDEDFSKYELRSGDIVFARTGATTGKSFLIESAPEAVFASYLIRVQVESADLLPEFLILFFRTRLYWDAIKAGTTGSAQGGFNATKLSDLMIPFPTKEEQMDIVRQANRLKDETKQLETTYQQKLMELEGLKKGLLGAAFRGEL